MGDKSDRGAAADRTLQLFLENKLIYPYKDANTLPPKKGIESHVFDLNSPPEKIVYSKRIKPVKDSVMFNDDYVETKQPIHFQRRRNDNSEKYSQSTYDKHNTKFSDDFKVDLSKNTNMSRRVKDLYGTNPIHMLNKEQTQQMNKQNESKFENRKEAINKYLSSNGVKKTFRDLKKVPMANEVDKITNVPVAAIKKAHEDKKDSQPNYTRKGFKKYYMEMEYKKPAKGAANDKEAKKDTTVKKVLYV